MKGPLPTLHIPASPDQAGWHAAGGPGPSRHLPADPDRLGWRATGRAGIKRLVAAPGASLALVLTLVVPASGSTSHETSDVFDLTQGLAVVDGADASLVRGPNGLTMNIQTSGLNGGHAYTVWWIVFNNPEHCENPMLPGLRCGFEDLYAPDFGLEGNPAVEATILHATGHVVGQAGKAGFGARLRPGGTDAVLGDGLSDIDGAEVILDLLDHGPKDPGNVPKQIHEFVTVEGSCNPECIDHQVAGFAP